MRRKDREITDMNEIVEIMKKCDTCRLAINDPEGYPYIVPLNFGFDFEDEQLYLYFHSAKEGKKLDLMKLDPRVTFEMDTSHQIILYVERMSCTMGYESIIGRGMVEEVEDQMMGLKIIMRQFHSEDFVFNTKLVPATYVFRVKVQSITGKRRDNIHPEEKTKYTIDLNPSDHK